MKKRILFLCTENSARSQMAEALVNGLYSANFQAFSAGTAPSNLDPEAMEAIDRFGLSHQGLRSKSLSEFEDESFDFVITLCGKASRECRKFPRAGEQLAWDFEDPKSRKSIKPYDTTLKELNERMKMLALVQSRKSKSP